MSNTSDFIIENGVLKKYVGDAIDVVIPNCVSEIAQDAFRYCFNMRSVVIPGNIKHIVPSTFYECVSMEWVQLESGLQTIGDWAFERCFSLQSIHIPKGVWKLGARAFSECSQLRSVSIPTDMISIGDCAFYGCSKLDYVMFPAKHLDDKLECIFKKCNEEFAMIAPYLPFGERGFENRMLFGYAKAQSMGIQYSEQQRTAYEKYLKQQKDNLLPIATAKNTDLLRLMMGHDLIPVELVDELLEKHEETALRAELLEYKHRHMIMGNVNNDKYYDDLKL